MPKKRQVLTLEGDLVWSKNSMFPRPGVVVFDIRKNVDGKGKTIIDNQIMIRRDLLPEISTARHVHGTITVEFFETDPERVEYTQNVEQIESAKTRGKNVKSKPKA